MDETMLSIIIPHYNIPELLDKLLGSIPVRPDIQTLVIDDNSDRRTAELRAVLEKHAALGLEFYRNPAAQHSTGLCRNVGLDHARGRWILFADADDYFTDGWLEKVAPYFDSDCDLVYFSHTSVCLASGLPDTRHRDAESRINAYCSQPSRANELRMRYDFVTVCAVLHRRAFLEAEGLRFESNPVEDLLFFVETGRRCRTFACSRDAIYCATKREGSKTAHITPELADWRARMQIRRLGLVYADLSPAEIRSLDFDFAGLQLLYNTLADGRGLRRVREYRRLLRAEGVPLLLWRYAAPKRYAALLRNNLRWRKAAKP